jgi:hypothetical protein
MEQAGPGGSGVHAVAATGYAEAGTAYERGRPEYPPAAVAALAHALAIAPGKRVLDLGAGTGKLTRRLSPAGARLVAVEPVATMRRAFDAGSGFTSLQEAQFPFSHQADRETAVARVASTSFVGTLSTEERLEVLQRVTAFLDGHPDTRGRETLALPYRADVYWCTRLP